MAPRSSAPSVAGKVVVVTGAARGLGAGLAEELTRRGAKVALLGLEPAELAAVSDRCPGSRWWEVNVTDEDGLRAVADEVRTAFGRVDAVVANAGVASGGTLRHADPGAFDRTVEVNLLGSIRTARAFLPALLDTRGYFLQVASLAALSPIPLMAAYCASKAGVEAFAESLRVELAYQGVKVGVAYLSWTDTDMVRGADERPELARWRAELPGPIGKTYPAGPAIQRLADGIERRAAHVYGQPWIRFVRPIRGFLPALTYAVARSQVPEADRLFQAAGRDIGLVGAGGAADRAASGQQGAAREPQHTGNEVRTSRYFADVVGSGRGQSATAGETTGSPVG